MVPRTLSEAPPLTDDLRLQCEEPGPKYNATNACQGKLDYWIGTMPGAQAEDNCVINEKTKEMDCHRKRSCEGGHPYKHDVNFLVYPCGSSCKGSLLIDCCNTCERYRLNPMALHVRTVKCEGCNYEALQSAANDGDCVFDGSKFNCASQNACRLGKMTMEKSSCLIYPCSVCVDPVLKRTCCQECLELQCESSQDSRMVCEGCDVYGTDTSSSGGGLPWLLMISLLLLGVLAVFAVWYVSRYQLRYGAASEEERRELSAEGSDTEE
eukprot:NODE_2288_length_961_cov_275.844371.p1 GENE.NODE_2288_length_961_cov_275.844371~~NODE_2288_length_961_cov_275.844371.p1  ORF type:complete len:289 (-),score=60.79 NODE_2288_length_961_cov_275.844371:79-879(-)